MFVDMFDLQCDNCGERLARPKTSTWQAAQTAEDTYGWETRTSMKSGWAERQYHFCPQCKGLKHVVARFQPLHQRSG